MTSRQYRGSYGPAAPRTRVNDQIRAREVRVIAEDGQQIGIMSSEEALRLAGERDLDLVEVAPDATPPVCRVMNYSKYRYEQSRRARAARKHQKNIEIKEIRLTFGMADHDVAYRVRHAEEFLRNGAKVRATLRFSGREIVHANLGEEMLLQFAEQLQSVGVMEQSPRLEGRSMALMLGPRPEGAASPSA
jgi:translation initiation factor IF-3